MRTVSVRGGFSDRNGIDALNTEIQLTSFDKRTRVCLFNAIVKVYEIAYIGKDWDHPRKQDFMRFVAIGIYNMEKKYNKFYFEDSTFDILHETLFGDSYDKVLTVIECIGKYMDNYFSYNDSSYYIQTGKTVFDYFNSIFEQEYVGYRFINGEISPISNDVEIRAITDSMQNPFAAVHDHIAKANRFLSDREKPDYENSIKESISAVEAMCQEILGIKGKKASLGNMLKNLESNGINIHSALKEAFNSMFGYTSDAKGIRHAGNLGGSSATFEEAKFMLVSCCAFINYLMGVSVKMKDVGQYESTKEQ